MARRWRRAVDRCDDWLARQPLWVVVPLAVVLVPVWLVLCFVLAAVVIDWVMRMLH